MFPVAIPVSSYPKSLLMDLDSNQRLVRKLLIQFKNSMSKFEKKNLKYSLIITKIN